MNKDTIASFSDPALRDELTDLVQDGARRMLQCRSTLVKSGSCKVQMSAFSHSDIRYLRSMPLRSVPGNSL